MKMMTKKNNSALTEKEKQTKPMPGETDPKDAFIKARLFANDVKSKMKVNGAKFK